MVRGINVRHWSVVAIRRLRIREQQTWGCYYWPSLLLLQVSLILHWRISWRRSNQLQEFSFQQKFHEQFLLELDGFLDGVTEVYQNLSFPDFKICCNIFVLLGCSQPKLCGSGNRWEVQFASKTFKSLKAIAITEHKTLNAVCLKSALSVFTALLAFRLSRRKRLHLCLHQSSLVWDFGWQHSVCWNQIQGQCEVHSPQRQTGEGSRPGTWYTKQHKS